MLIAVANVPRDDLSLRTLRIQTAASPSVVGLLSILVTQTRLGGQPPFLDCFCDTPPTNSPICNPVSQAGCASGEKCSSLVIVETPLFSQIVCVPDGVRGAGESCSQGIPGESTGYDNCLAGYGCFQSKCVAICDHLPDSCDGAMVDDDLGEACANHPGGHFNDSIGICLGVCDPIEEIISSGMIENPSCEKGACFLDIDTGVSTCSEAPPEAALSTQNHAPATGSSGSEFSAACAPGFSALLTSQNNTNSAAQCARYCTPVDTTLEGVENATGANGKCASGNLDMVGGRNNNQVEHQCRYIQSLVHGGENVSANIGMCVPVTPIEEGAFLLENGAKIHNSFSNCLQFDWLGIKAVWNSAAPSGRIAAQQAFNDFCLTDPDSPTSSQIYDKCQGLFFGCVSSETLAELTEPKGP